CGAGICFNRSNGSLINTIVWENYASPSDSQIVLWDSSPDIRYCDIEGGWEGEGNIDEDPQFVEPYIYNFNVYSSSPCIDAGDPDITDPDSTRSDIGLYFSFHPDYPPSGSVWYVSTTGNDSTGDGSPENPYRTIQFAVDTSYIRDTIIVENGVYEENVSLVNKSLILASRYIFTEDSSDIENTIIDGRGISSVVYSEHCDSLSKFMGFTIRNGSNSGIHCISSYITISNNIVTNNTAEEYGGGIYCHGYGTKPKIIENIIRENYAEEGGGIFCNHVIPQINNNIIYDNTATEEGGGILLWNSDYLSTIKENFISKNTSVWGGGIRIRRSRVQVIGNLISNNNARRHGGGVYCGGNRSARFYDNTIVENRAEKGGGIVLATDLYLYLRNCIIWENRTLLNEENNLW
ncbi:MAG: DUF1565 domain-containing protein, partial [candidate division Zixibacteria bacterium]|nr:DUF1565 domain-containing protein [candidate division Zixibacteria bacterium]